MTLLSDIPSIQPIYFLPDDNLAEEVLIPGFKAADKVDCMVSFFASAVLASLAPGLAAYVGNARHSFRLIVGPFLRPEDRAAIEEGVKFSEAIAQEVLEDPNQRYSTSNRQIEKHFCQDRPSFSGSKPLATRAKIGPLF